MELEKEVISCQDELLAKERKMQKEVEESNERLFRAEKREEEARKEEEEKWKDKLDEVVKVSKIIACFCVYSTMGAMTT